MKRILALTLAVILTMSLCACGAGKGEKAQGLQVGYGKANITPNFPVGMAGYSDNATRRVTGFVDYIYATCIAVTEGDETILIYTIDNLGLNGASQDKIRSAITKELEIDGDHIFIGATHTHSAPSYNSTDTEGVKYQNMLHTAMVEAAQTALQDRSAATINAATPIIEGMNFVRHYKLTDGTVAGPNFGGTYDDTNIAEHAGASDPQMVLVQFDRGEDKKDILMVNWQAHPASGKTYIDYTSVSSDWVGRLRDKVEELSGMLVTYLPGASGDLNRDSHMSSLSNNLTWQEYGAKMGELTYESLGQLKPVEGSGITTNYYLYDAEVDHSWDHMINEANEVYDLWKSMGKAAGDALGKTYGFSSVYQARAIRTRAEEDATYPMQMRAFSIGGIGFITGTYEMANANGRYVKENSPFPVTVVIAGNSTYIPRAEAYDYRSYEADTSLYAKGTGEAMAEKYVEMLKEIAPSA